MTGNKSKKTHSNVFADLGLPDAEELLAKSRLAVQVIMIVKEQGLTNAEAAKRLGVGQRMVSDLFDGKLRKFSVYKLASLISTLGRKVNIVISNPARPEEATTIPVS